MINKHICNFLIFTFALGFALAMAGCGGAAGSANLNASSSVVIIPSVTSATEGQQVNLTASISPSLATGTVSFYNGSNLIGTAMVSNVATSAIAELSTTFSSPGTQTITAKYSGNQFFAPSESGPATIGIYSNQLAATTTTLQTSNAAPAFDTNVTLTAMVSPSSATGSVTFYNGAVSIGTGAVSSGAATLVTQFAAGGTIALKAIYLGQLLQRHQHIKRGNRDRQRPARHFDQPSGIDAGNRRRRKCDADGDSFAFNRDRLNHFLQWLNRDWDREHQLRHSHADSHIFYCRAAVADSQL